MGDLFLFLAPERNSNEARLASIEAHRHPVIRDWSAESEGYPLHMGIKAPYDSAMCAWLMRSLWLRFNPRGIDEPRNVVDRPSTVLWRPNEQEFLVVVSSLSRIFAVTQPVAVDIGIDGQTWRRLPFYDRFAVAPPLPLMALGLIAAQIRNMRSHYFPRIISVSAGTHLTLEVDTSLPHAECLVGHAGFQVTLKSGGIVEADICTSELYLIGTWKFSAVFAERIGFADVDHVDLVLPMSPTTIFTHRLI